MTTPRVSTSNTRLADTAGFELLRDDLAADLQRGLADSLAGGAVFAEGTDPLTLFRAALAGAIRDIEAHPRGEDFISFLLKGPHDQEGPIPAELRAKRISDEQAATVVNFITGHMVKSFQGALAELLAVAPCLSRLRRRQQQGAVPTEARLFVGDAVKVRQLRRPAFAKGADFHFLIAPAPSETNDAPAVTLLGIGEVKSNFTPAARLAAQVEKHRARPRSGVRLGNRECSVATLAGGAATFSVVVQPDDWRLPRTLRWEPTGNGRQLHLDRGAPTHPDDRIEQISAKDWRITLRWSREALAAAAYDMTFWYMEKVGEVIYRQRSDLPKNWTEMSAAEVGRNAAKQMLHYAVFRFLPHRSKRTAPFHLPLNHAVALYNTYGFGYALGMNYRGEDGFRDMLYPEDLDEIATSGVTTNGGRIAG